MPDAAIIERTVDFLTQFGLALNNDRDLNDLKILRQEPAIAVIGLVSRGKSTLVNKLIGVDLLPTGPNPVTFGNIFLRSGPASASGRLRTGMSIKLPTLPEEFKQRSRRHDGQDIADSEYSGSLRLPEGVMLIDTKGLDETSVDFDGDLKGLERSWAGQGAMAAILVTSVPPGPSALDIRLHGDLLVHFSGNVIVVMKQTDSGLTQSELEESADIWRQRGAEVFVVSDGRPDSVAEWGTGPLAELESRMAAIWSSSSGSREVARERLERSLTDLANSIPVPRGRASNDVELRQRFWRGFADVTLLASVREVVRGRLVEAFESDAPSVVTREDAETALRYASIGSNVALRKLKEGLQIDSRLRRVVSLDDLVRMAHRESPRLLEAAFDNCRISSDDEYVRMSELVRELRLVDGSLSVVRRCCISFLESVDSEARLISLLHRGHDSLAPDVVVLLLRRWWRSVAQNERLSMGTQKLELAIGQKHRALLSSQSRISTEVISLLVPIARYSAEWGVSELERYRQSGVRLLGMSVEEARSANPFAALGERAERLKDLLERLSVLSRVVDPTTADAIAFAAADLGPGSHKANWITASRNLVDHDSETRFNFMTVHGWLAVSAAVFALLAFANDAFGLAVFLVALGVFEWARWWILGSMGTLRIRPYSPGGKIRDVKQRMAWMHIRSAGIVLCCATLAVMVSTVAQRLDRNRIDSQFASQATPVSAESPSTTLRRPSTTTTTPRPAFSSTDVIDEEFQDAQGLVIEEADLSSVDAANIRYAFVLSQGWNDLPLEMRIQFCWIGFEGRVHSCGDTAGARALQITDRVVYGLKVPLPSDTPSGPYVLSLEIPVLESRVMSAISLTVSSSVPPDSTAVSLPYRTDRNRWWNANCPKTLRKNEILPLKICDEGRGVKRVQRLLGLDADGYFGNGTHNAIVDFQFQNGLLPTGIVDRDTWYALDESQGGPGEDLNRDGLVTPDEFR